MTISRHRYLVEGLSGGLTARFKIQNLQAIIVFNNAELQNATYYFLFKHDTYI